ncbi:uncharacterized protein DSM5745_00777 [Aspergillus mulundensis]|uniref:Uncharacterized protein n=1 Tax=Aspergillus mulundensis TaxID=1810919 RepID=A0A3D8T4H6_9EURO|nr:hypothetical protein DSM5745_00777 [Aspergillus mulundensis]RDW93455.1 hypothetical protein DSM5745_00777 [Aspergillus mulundensis]
MAKKNENPSLPSVVPAKRPVRRSSRTVAAKRPRQVQPGSVTETVIESDNSFQERDDRAGDGVGVGIGNPEHEGDVHGNISVGYPAEFQQDEGRGEEVAHQTGDTEMVAGLGSGNDLTSCCAAKQLRRLNIAAPWVDDQAGREGCLNTAPPSHLAEEHQTPPVSDTEMQLKSIAVSSSEPATVNVTATVLQLGPSAPFGAHLGDECSAAPALPNGNGSFQATAETVGTAVRSDQFTDATYPVALYEDSATRAMPEIATVPPNETEQEKAFHRLSNHVASLEIYAERVRSELSAKTSENEALAKEVDERDKRIQELEKALAARPKEFLSATQAEDIEGVEYTNKDARIQELEGCVVDQAIMTVSQAKEIKKLTEALKEYEARIQDARELKTGLCNVVQEKM